MAASKVGDVVRALLWHPVPLGALGVLALNDHFFKGSGLLPAWLTGKLSDVAGLAYFPLLLVALAVACAAFVNRCLAGQRYIRASEGWVTAACVVSAASFTLIKTIPEIRTAAVALVVWAQPFRSVHARIVVDPTDLIALPAVGIAWLHGRRALRRSGPPTL